MKKLLLILIIFLFCIISSCSEKEEITIINNVINQETDVEDTITLNNFEDVLCNTSELVKGCVVGVKASNSYSLVNSEVTGSGVVVKKTDNTYYIVTNRHIVCKSASTICDRIYVYLGTLNITLNANLVKYDVDTDLALIKIETEVELMVAKMGDSNKLKVGKFVISVGSPYDLEKYYNTVTFGNVSCEKRVVVQKNLNNVDVENIYIQHDSAINVGSSGGGLFNLQGELVGINTWKVVGNNNIDLMSFAVPSSVICEVFESYLN